MRSVASDPLPLTIEGPYEAPYCIARGQARGTRFSPDGYSLWRVIGDLAPGATLEWGSQHGDEALYVYAGALEVGGTRVDAEAAVVLEAGVPTQVRALEASRLIHFGPEQADPPRAGPYGPADPNGHGVHIIPLAEAEYTDPTGEPGTGMAFFSDGTCQSCRIALFMAFCDADSGYATASHTHSEDEIIHVLDGTLQVGAVQVEAGMSIAVPHDLRYGFRTKGPYRILNYRRDVSSYAGAPASEPFLEVLSVVRGGVPLLE